MRLKESEPVSRPPENCGQVGDPRGEGIDDSVHGAGAEHGRAGTAQHFDGAGLFVIELEHFVDVAESDGADRQAVLGHEECPARPGARQHRRADRRQALRAAAPLDVDARDLVERFGLVLGTERLEVGAVDARHAGGSGECVARCAIGRHHDRFDIRHGRLLGGLRVGGVGGVCRERQQGHRGEGYAHDWVADYRH
jgi:hypothetical protein